MKKSFQIVGSKKKTGEELGTGSYFSFSLFYLVSAFYQAEYNWDGIAERTVEVYRKVFANRA